MTTRNQVLDALANVSLHPDKLTAHRDGTFTVRKSYFYRHGYSEDIMAEEIMKAFPGCLITECLDNWQPWPRDSYFEVTFSPEMS